MECKSKVTVFNKIYSGAERK